MDLHGGRVTATGVDIPNPLACDEMIEAIFTEGPLTTSSQRRRQFRLPHQDLTPRGFRCGRQHRQCTARFIDACGGRRWIAGTHPGIVVSIT